MADVRRVISIEAKIAQSAVAQMKSMEQALGGIEKSASLATTAVKGFVGGLVGAISVGTIVSGFKSLVDEMDALNDASERLGVSTENLSAWGYAAEMSGTDADTLYKAIGKLSVEMETFDDVSAKSTKALQSLGVTADDVAQGTDAVFSKIADGFAKMPDGAGKTAKAIELFGKSGAQLIPFLNQGSAGLEDLRREAERLGVVLDSDASKAAGNFNDSVDRVTKAVHGSALAIAQGMLPKLLSVTEAFGDASTKAQTFQAVGRDLGDMAKWLSGMFLKSAATVKAFGASLGMVSDVTSALIEGRFGDVKGIFSAYVADVNKLEADTNAVLERMRNPNLSDMLPFAGDAPKRTASAIDAISDAAKGAGNKISDFERRLKSLNEELFKASQPEAAQTAIGKLTYDIEQGVINVTKAEADQLYMTAALVDATNRDVEAEKARKQALDDSTKAQQEQITAQAQFLDQAKSQTQAGQLEAAIDNWYRLEQIIAQTGDTSIAAAQALEGAKKKVDDLISGKSVDGFEQLLSAIDGYGKQVSGTLVGAIDSTKEFGDAFGDMVAGVLKDIAQMVLQILVVQPLIDSLKASLKSAQASGGGIGGFFSSLFSADGNAFDGGVHAFAGGGIFGPNGGVTPGPVLFPFAQGIGLAGEAGTEAILPLQRGPDGKLGVANNGGGSGDVVVNVYPQPGETATVRQSNTADGKQIDIYIDKRVRDGITNGNFDTAFNQVYGLNRRGR
ncbi:hypothetical protein LMG23992_02115 [Cupriavidus laharis]|uniref:Bacteriophage tail tape measure C-terminal domain-containing protein n=1 Tax=Cupriavidus laharis TaxID=151654 RepID=A0ABN7YIA7_9BURK|nr:hypothetical protein [Cupriavidus laharis]CAG9172086.1 hypothetical protein LMG23992_02115 [Cupriavidus laharis]